MDIDYLAADNHQGCLNLKSKWGLPMNPSLEARTRTQKHKQENDPRHTLYGHVKPRSRLKSRSAFMTTESLDPEEASRYRLTEWREWDQITDNTAVQEPTEELAKGTDRPRRE